jgi:hypothetical protein
MDPDHLLIEKLARAARSVGRATTVVKVICAVAYLFAGGFFLYGLSRIDRGDDFMVMSVLALAIAAVAALFWSIASFHVASVHGMGLLASLHAKLDALLGAMAAGAAQANEAAARRAGRVRARADLAAPSPALETAPATAHAPAQQGEVSRVIAAPSRPPAGGLDPRHQESSDAAGGEALASAGVAPSVASLPAAPSPEPEGDPEVAPKAPRPLPTDGVETKACRACGSEIRADATRCRWCMKVA